MNRHFSSRTFREKSSQPQRWGAVIVETAIVMPVFMVIVCGMVELGRAMMVAQLTSNAARIGVRSAVLDGSTNATITGDVRSFLVRSVKGISADDVSVSIEITPAGGNQNPHTQLSNAKTNDLCRVSVAIPFNKVAYFSPRFLAGANLRGSCSMSRE